MGDQKQCTITLKYGKQQNMIPCNNGSILLDVLNSNDIFIDAPCGGKGLCGKCKVKVEGQQASIPDTDELKKLNKNEIEAGYRLACRTKIAGDITVTLDSERSAHIAYSGMRRKVDISPCVKKRYIRLEKPTVKDQRDDFKRLSDSLEIKNPSITLKLLSHIPAILRDSDFDVTAVYQNEHIISLESGNSEHINYGVAIDIGTTTVVAYLIDLCTGENIDVVTQINSQKSYGADVISRIDAVIQKADALAQLQKKIIMQLNRMIVEMAERNGISVNHIYSIFIVGNTTMMHLLMGLSPKHIAVSPFIPVYTQRKMYPSEVLGFDFNPICMAALLPSVSGYVGADIIAAILSSGMTETDDFSLLIDIGTNGEIALGNAKHILCCSTAAGPAFEGAHIYYGMGGVAGAIKVIKYDNGGLFYKTIEDSPPIGICGSGIVDIIAILIQSGIIDETGRILECDEITLEEGKALKERIIEFDGMPAFLIAAENETESGESIVITQKDIREVQLAKAAIAAGIYTLVQKAGKKYEDISCIYLAGGFGSFINSKNAVAIGLLPKQLEDKIVVLGNAAGTGAIMSALSEEYFIKCDDIKRITDYIELSASPEFQEEYINNMYFR